MIYNSARDDGKERAQLCEICIEFRIVVKIAELAI